MGRWVETTTYWHGDLLHFERRPFTGWCVEGKRELGGTIRVVRIVTNEAQHLPHPEPDFEFLRVFALTALVQSTFLVMVALTPKPAPMLVMDESLHDPELRAGILAGGGDGWEARAIAPRLSMISAAPGPTRIVIPTPPGSRLRPNHELELPREYALLAMISRDHSAFDTLTGLESDTVYGGLIGSGICCVASPTTGLVARWLS